ncbi:MAG TPA: carboxypeptidase regulatory-like domain-containing protein [Polyangiaceae bacterium]
MTVALSVIACLAFVLSLRDLAGRKLVTPAFKIAEPIQISGHERTGSLHVTVVTESSAGVGGATVQVFWEHDARFYWAGAESSDGSGHALLQKLPQGRVWLLAEAPGFARSSSALLLSAEPRALRLTLHPAQKLAVTVQDETSLPIARATVLVDTADPLPFGALTDEHGVAQLARLGAAPWTVKASAPGYESVSRSGVRGSVAITLRRLAALEVAVLGVDGKVAPGATVMIAGPTLWPARSAAVDGQGVARIAGLLAGSYDLRASLGDAVAPTLLGFELARGANEKLTLRLEPGRTVVALVTDGEGPSPLVVANADVVLAEGGVSSFPIRGRTGTDGKVSLGPIASGPATLGARAEDFVGSALVAVPEVLDGPVRVPLTRGATIRGDVSDARGFPVDGATIEVVGSDPSGLPIAETPALVGFRQNHFAWSLPGPVPLIPAGELGVMPGPVPPIPKPGAAPEMSVNSADFQEPLADLAPWLTNRGGQFTARPITPGRVRVIVRHPDYVEGTSELTTVAAGGEAQVKIVLLKGGSLEGRVADERDQPLAGVEVELSSPNATRTESATTASDGSFAFAAVPSDITLSLSRAEDPARVVLRKSLHVAEGAKETLSLVLPTARDPVRIVVLDEDERPIELVEIAATSLEPTRPMRLTRFSDSQGSVTLDDALGENLRIVAEAPGYARVAQTVAAAPKELKLILKRGVIVEGRVTAVRGRRVVVGAVVTLQQDGVRKVATTDADGAFRLRDVAPGEIRVRVEHPDFADEEAVQHVDSTGRADRAFSLPEIDLSEAGEVEGDLVDDRGERVAGARVMAGDAPSYLPAGRPRHGIVLSAADGHFVLSGVHPGTVTISAVSAVSGRGIAHAVEVSSGHTTRGLRIQLTVQARPTEDESVAAGSVAVTLGERGTAPNVEVVVVNVAEASEAERAGVQAGDVVAALDGARPSSMTDARSRLSGQPGSDLVLEVLRAGATLKFRVLREAVRR